MSANSKSDFVTGIDVSKWQGVIDWDAVGRSDAVFAYIKAGECNPTPFTDPQFPNNSLSAPHNLAAVGYYWFYRAEFGPDDQAYYFANLLNNSRWNLPPVIDIELNSENLSQSEMRKRAKRFVDIVRNETGHAFVTVYSRGIFWNDELGPDNAVNTFGQYPLWVARYAGYLDGPWSDHDRYRPNDWEDWNIWQYTDKGNASDYGITGSQSLDLNYFNGDVDALIAFIIRYGNPDNMPGETPTDPTDPGTPPGDILERLEAVEAELADHEKRIAALEQSVDKLESEVASMDARMLKAGKALQGE